MQKFIFPLSILFSVLIILGAVAYRSGLETAVPDFSTPTTSSGSADVFWPEWGDIGKRLIEVGVIDADKFESVYARRGGLSNEEKELLYGVNNGKLVVNEENAGVVLNLLWAFGLVNKNPILEKGPMMDVRYGGAGNFASTGGWTLAKGEAMEYYSKYPIVALNDEQQALLERVSKNIYRPCCNNATYFPDCNHGMAMLGLLELLAAQGASEEEMYQTALLVNSYWFPDTYSTIAAYLKSKDVAIENVDPKEILGPKFSSYSGFSRILAEFTPPDKGSGASCGV